MQIHILTGDALAHQFQYASIEGNVIVSRECLIDGDVRGKDLKEFWATRANFIADTYADSATSYLEKVAYEYEKIFSLPTESEVNLWFEHDLFCQVNMWFTIWLLNRTNIKNIYRISPQIRENESPWKGFANADSKELQQCFAQRTKFEEKDLALGVNLWEAYQNQHLRELGVYAQTQSSCFPYLKEVCEAEVARKERNEPEQFIKKLILEGMTDFDDIFSHFSKQKAIYGLGDLQVKQIYEKITQSSKLP
jgi:Domain of unknown function (DUF1835)